MVCTCGGDISKDRGVAVTLNGQGPGGGITNPPGSTGERQRPPMLLVMVFGLVELSGVQAPKVKP